MTTVQIEAVIQEARNRYGRNPSIYDVASVALTMAQEAAYKREEGLLQQAGLRWVAVAKGQFKLVHL